MKKMVIPVNDKKALSEAVRVLNMGGLVVFPTDTVYGLAAKVIDTAAIERIFSVKDREHTKAIAVLLGDLAQLEIVAADIPEYGKKILSAFWPGALTAVLSKKAGLPENLSPYPTVGVRIPDYSFVQKLALAVGPLATTSANISGADTATNAEMALSQLGDRVDLIIDGGECAGGVASTVVDLTKKELTILREGAISENEILSVINR